MGPAFSHLSRYRKQYELHCSAAETKVLAQVLISLCVLWKVKKKKKEKSQLSHSTQPED